MVSISNSAHPEKAVGTITFADQVKIPECCLTLPLTRRDVVKIITGVSFTIDESQSAV